MLRHLYSSYSMYIAHAFPKILTQTVSIVGAWDMYSTTRPASFLRTDRCIFRLFSALGMPPLDFDRHGERIISSPVSRNCTLIVLLVNFVIAIVLFIRVQLVWQARLCNNLSSVSATIRGFATVYAYEALVIVAIWHRHRYAAYFNHLNAIDQHMWLSQGVRPNHRRLRRKFWLHTGIWMFNYLVVSMPLGIYVFVNESMLEAGYMTEYVFMAVMLGGSTAFLQYAVACYLVRIACARQCLTDAVGAAGSLSDIKSVLRILGELDTAKEMLSEDFGPLITWKFLIDGANTILIVHLTIIKMLSFQLSTWLGFADYAIYEWPYIVADVTLVMFFQAIGDAVRACVCFVGESAFPLTQAHPPPLPSSLTDNIVACLSSVTRSCKCKGVTANIC